MTTLSAQSYYNISLLIFDFSNFLPFSWHHYWQIELISQICVNIFFNSEQPISKISEKKNSETLISWSPLFSIIKI